MRKNMEQSRLGAKLSNDERPDVPGHCIHVRKHEEDRSDLPTSSLASHNHWARINSSIAPRSKLSQINRWLLGGALTYDNFLMMRILEDYIPRPAIAPDRSGGRRCIEIGCAPGHTLLALSAHFGLEPFGIDYTESGYAATIREFEAANVSTDGIILGDIEDPEFRKHYEGYFNVVFSNGFIEHFTNPEDIVSYHIDLLAPGGQLVVMIPNLRDSLYHLSAAILDPGILAKHNLTIMDISTFRGIFHHQSLVSHHCDYCGALNLANMFPPNKLPYARYILHRIQNIVDVFLRMLLPWWRPSNRFVSPFLLYVGTKTR